MECRVTLGAPHLVASFYLMDRCRAFGARLGVCAQHLDGFKYIRIAYMLLVAFFLAFKFKTLVACLSGRTSHTCVDCSTYLGNLSSDICCTSVGLTLCRRLVCKFMRFCKSVSIPQLIPLDARSCLRASSHSFFACSRAVFAFFIRVYVSSNSASSCLTALHCSMYSMASGDFANSRSNSTVLRPIFCNRHCATSFPNWC